MPRCLLLEILYNRNCIFQNEKAIILIYNSNISLLNNYICNTDIIQHLIINIDLYL